MWWIVLTTLPRWLYYLVLRIRESLYARDILKTQKLPGKVISIGNIEVGGTGKTPICILIANYLLEKGKYPAILTRGYRSGLSHEDCIVINDGQITNLKGGKSKALNLDEPLLQSFYLPNVPVIVGANRFVAANSYLEKHGPSITHWILDDGFQHRQIARDMEIVLLDWELPLANRYVLPTGRLRDFPSRLKQASFIIYTRSQIDQPPNFFYSQEINQIESSRCKFSLRKIVSIREKNKNFPGAIGAVLVSAIGKNDNFRVDVERFGVQVLEHIAKPDHYLFKKEELQDVAAKGVPIITTEKDYWRQPNLYNDLPNEVFLAKLEVELFDRRLFVSIPL